MRFRRRHRRSMTNGLETRADARRKIWEDPTIIEEMFNDAEWQRYQEGADYSVPSQKMAQRIEGEVDRDKRKVKHDEIRLRYTNRIMEIGIAAALLLFISFQVWRQSQQVDQPEFQLYAQQDSAVTVIPRWVSIFNNSDQIDTMRLPDQSTVHLFAQSSLRYRDNFSVAARDIHLEGKGFFAVAKDTNRPFSVYAGKTKTTALGTSFTIDTRVEQQHTAVELHSGKIIVASTADIPVFEDVFLDRQGTSLLLADNMGVVRQKQERSEKTPRVVESVPLPIPTFDNQLHMENIPLPDVFATLEEAYHTVIHIRDEGIDKIQYTGVIDPESESLTDVLMIICLINDLRYEKEEKGSYSIYRQKTKASEENVVAPSVAGYGEFLEER